MINITPLSNVYLGDWTDAYKRQPGEPRKPQADVSITHVLNVAVDADPGREKLWPGAAYIHIGMVDGPGNSARQMQACVDILEMLAARGPNVRVLVHCVSGISRSATVIVKLMRRWGNAKSNEEAVAMLKMHRPCVNPKQELLDL